jgi:hypothetical protein
MAGGPHVFTGRRYLPGHRSSLRHEELLARLAHPFWFQSFGAVMGMDWHSSGITTSVTGDSGKSSV